MRLSIIVPVYNEEKRVPTFLKGLVEYSKKHFNDYEIIIVNDGSKDNTENVVKAIIRKDANSRILSYKRNKGKGYAVRKGVLESKGKDVLFIDADGSIAPDQIPLMLDKLKEYDIVVGCRRIKEAGVKASMLRVFIGTFFNYYANALYRINVRDTLCGFKGFKRNAAINLFKDMISERWIFDVELFYKIRRRGLSLYQLPIVWVHKKGTKIGLLDPLKMAWQLIVLRIRIMRN
ncbi:MAG: glycosyltransferase family 2 protein [Candidatus Woesearchaeota archaeon]|nr:glycosyltransferase family 2 protein [Candidatus Woesearchaeota archaeon]